MPVAFRWTEDWEVQGKVSVFSVQCSDKARRTGTVGARWLRFARLTTGFCAKRWMAQGGAMAFHSFERLEVWQRARRLAVDTYRTLRSCPDRALKEQMTRAAVSVASNIAEGAERTGDRDFIRFEGVTNFVCWAIMFRGGHHGTTDTTQD